MRRVDHETTISSDQKWSRSASDHAIERLMQEIKRRTRVIRIFPNRDACLRLMTALCAEQSDEWISGMRYLDIGELRGWRREQEQVEMTLLAM
jgi:transposase-like protein